MISKPATLICTSGRPVVLRSVKAQGRLSGLLLTMTLHQTFRNDEAAHIEVTYTFPLPWGAVLTGLEATLGDKRMRGQVMARRQAAQRYEDAVEQGDAPVMVEKNEDGSFTASLGSLKPGEQATIELSYAQLLNFEQGRVRLVVPMLLPSTLACAPPNAHREVLSRVHWVTQAPAGHGAVREVCDLLLQARGDYAALLNQVLL